MGLKPDLVNQNGSKVEECSNIIRIVLRDDKYVLTTLLRNKKFMLDEMTRQNASKFAIFYIYENPNLLFPFFISCYFSFSLMNAQVYVQIDQSIH